MDVVILERDEAGNTRRTRLNKDTDSDDRVRQALVFIPRPLNVDL